MMEEKIKEILQNGPLSSEDIATKLNKRKVKEIQKSLNKLQKLNIIKMDKSDNRLKWSLVDDDGAWTVYDVSTSNDDEQESVSSVNRNKVPDKVVETEQEDSSNVNRSNITEKIVETTQENTDVSELDPGKHTYQGLLRTVTQSYKDEITFLRNEIKQKNEILASQQQIIYLHEFERYRKTYKDPRVLAQHIGLDNMTYYPTPNTMMPVVTYQQMWKKRQRAKARETTSQKAAGK